METNRVDLDPDVKDAQGLPVARITHRQHLNDIATGAGSQSGSRGWRGPASRLDPDCRAHDVPNLWVVDGSCFPTAGGYNPTLTLLANAYRVADRFVAEARRQNL
jgi:hypothetical protein